jgi:AraC-like DNA-binding protein
MLALPRMPRAPRDSTEPRREADAAERQILVREGLRSLHLSGALFLRAYFSEPWAYESPAPEQVAEMLRPGGRRIILFHIFTEGRCRVKLDGGVEGELTAGDVAILPFTDRHKVGHPSVEGAVALGGLMPPPPWKELPVLKLGGGGAPASMVCGYLFSDDVPFNPVFDSLPPFIRVRPEGGPLGGWVQASIDYVVHASSQSLSGPPDPLLQRLPELLVTECLCAFAAQDADSSRGWLAALADPVVGRALSCMHREPAAAWTMKDLAKRAATSRTVLDERFRAVVGRAPMTYLTGYRLQLAARHLRTTSSTLAEVAEAVGYGSEASFSRAFKRQVGVSPSEWRAERSAPR